MNDTMTISRALGNKKPAWGEGFTTIGHAVLNNSINFKNRLHKPGLSAVQPD